MTRKTAEQPAEAEKAVACDNHPDRDAVLVTDGKAFQELHLCAACVPKSWDWGKGK